MVKNPPANAGDTGSVPDQGRFHMLQSNSARAPQLLSPSAAAREAWALHLEGSPARCNSRKSVHSSEDPAHQ